MALTDKLTSVADAIRAKTGDTALLALDQMPTAINNISSGGEVSVVDTVTVMWNSTAQPSPMPKIFYTSYINGVMSEMSTNCVSNSYNVGSMTRYRNVAMAGPVPANSIFVVTTGGQSFSTIDCELIETATGYSVFKAVSTADPDDGPSAPGEDL